jgi:hypothetical protein
MCRKCLAFYFLLISSIVTAQPGTDQLLSKIFSGNQDSIFKKVIAAPDSFRLQVIYTEINRDKNNTPHFTHHYFNYDTEMYFNPASLVKLPLALLSLEKLNTMSKPGGKKYTTILFDSSRPWQRPLYRDTTSPDGLPSIAHLVKRALLISENDPYNRMYQFVGQQEINRNLKNKGYKDVRITRQFLGLSPEQNRYSNPVRFVDRGGKTLYEQPEAYNTDTFYFSKPIKLGNAHYDRNDSLIKGPFDFTVHNSISLESMHQLLQSVLFPSSATRVKRFNLTADDHSFLLRYLSQYPSETPDPRYDTTLFYDSYVKFFFRNDSHKIPSYIRVFNKVGWSYGFVTDVSYVVDFRNKVEFMLAATLYVNSDGVINDGRYDYKTIGYPFLYQLGQAIYNYELKRKRKYVPDLSAFKIRYEQRDPNDKRAMLREVDN